MSDPHHEAEPGPVDITDEDDQREDRRGTQKRGDEAERGIDGHERPKQGHGTRVAYRRQVRARVSATAMMSEPPTISARSSDASTALDETRSGSFGSAEITNGSENARSPAIETMTSVAF